jgi:hypothetical protein
MEPLLGSRLHPIPSYLIESIFAIGPFQIFSTLKWRAELPEEFRRARKGHGSLTPNAGAKKIIASARRAAWGGFDPKNDQGCSHQEMSESYRESCEREIRNLIGNAVPKNFSWEDLMKFVPDGEQIIAVTPEYKSRRKYMPAGVILLLSNDEVVRLSFF